MSEMGWISVLHIAHEPSHAHLELLVLCLLLVAHSPRTCLCTPSAFPPTRGTFTIIILKIKHTMVVQLKTKMLV